MSDWQELKRNIGKAYCAKCDDLSVIYTMRHDHVEDKHFEGYLCKKHKDEMDIASTKDLIEAAKWHQEHDEPRPGDEYISFDELMKELGL